MPRHHISVKEAIERARAGRPVLIIDDKDRENEADLCIPAEFATGPMVNLARQAGGLLCVSMSGELLDHFGIPLVPQRDSLQGTPFAESVDYLVGTTTGISVEDRAACCRALADPNTPPSDFGRPGHIFPLRAHPDGTLGRRGHTEASVDLMVAAGLSPAAVICEVLDPTGKPARGKTLQHVASRWKLGIVTVEDIAHAQYRATGK